MNAPSATPQGEAEVVAVAYFEALADERWLDAARLVDSEVVERFHVEQVQALTSEPVHRPSEAELIDLMMRHDPEMPREVAVYLVRRSNEAFEDRESHIAFQFAGVESAAQVLALSPLEMMARYLEARDPRYQFMRSIEQARKMAPEAWDPEEVEANRPTVGRTVIGSVVNGDSLTHVVYADGVFRAPPDFPSSVFLVTLRRTDAGWRVATPYLNLFGYGSVVSFTDLQPTNTLPPP